VRWRRERAAPCEERGCGERKLGGGDDDDQCAGQGGRWILEEDICSARLASVKAINIMEKGGLVGNARTVWMESVKKLIGSIYTSSVIRAKESPQ
jgi:hypothetical protein